MPRHPDQFGETQQGAELRQMFAEEILHPEAPDRNMNPMLYETLYGEAPVDVDQEICGLQDATRVEIADRLGLAPDQVITEFINRKVSAKARTAAREEEQQLCTNERWGFVQRTIAALRRGIQDTVIRRDSTHAERQYFGEGDVWNKIANILTQMTGPQTAGATMRLPLDAAGNFHIAAVNFTNRTTVPVIDPENPHTPHIGIEYIDWCRTPLWDIQEALRRAGQYEHFLSQEPYRNFETWRRRLDTIWYEILGTTWEENIATTLTSKNRLAENYRTDQYQIRTYLSPMIDVPYNFNDPATIGLTLRLQADSARAAHDPRNQVRLSARRERARQELGQNRTEYIEQKQRVSDLTKTINSLEAINNTTLESLLRELPKTALQVQNSMDASNLHRHPGNPAAVPPVAPHPFANLDEQIQYYQDQINQYQTELNAPGIAHARQLALNSNIGTTERKLKESQDLQGKISDAQQALRNQATELLDIFRVHFRDALTTAPQLVDPFPAGAPLDQLQNLLNAALGPVPPPPALNPTFILAQNILQNAPNFMGNLRNQIFNTNRTLPDNQNIARRMALYIEQQRAEEDRQKKIEQKMKADLDTSGVGSLTPREVWLAYEKAALFDRGITDPKERDLLAAQAVDKMLLEIEKAQNFIPYLNEELGQQMSRSVVGGMINRLNFWTYDEDDIIGNLKNYSRTHRKILRHLQPDSTVTDIIAAIDNPKNKINYAELPIVWNTIYQIIREKKIKGTDKEIEIQDSAGRPLQIFVDRLQEAYLSKKKEDLANNQLTKEEVMKKGTAAERLIAALDLQDKEIATERKTFDDNIKEICEFLEQKKRSFTDWIFGKNKVRQEAMTDIKKKMEKGETIDEKDKNFFEKLLGVDFNQLDAGDLLVFKELADIGKGVTDWLGLTGEQKGKIKAGRAASGLKYGAEKAWDASSWAWTKGTNGVKGGINLAGKAVTGAATIALLPAYPILHPKHTYYLAKKGAVGLFNLPLKLVSKTGKGIGTLLEKTDPFKNRATA